MIFYRKHTVKYNTGYWYVTRKGKDGSVEHETLTQAKSFIDSQCNMGLAKHAKGRHYV